MKRHPILSGLLFGLFTVIPVVVLLFLGQRFAGLPFVPFNIFDFLTRTLPGAVINPILELMVRIVSDLNIGPTGETAKAAEQGIGVVTFVVVGILFGGFLGFVGGRSGFRRSLHWGLGIGLALVVAALLIQAYLGITGSQLLASGSWLLILFGGWGLILGWLLRESQRIPPEPAGTGVSRREAIYLAGSALVAIVAGAVGLGYLFIRPKSRAVAPPVTVTPGSVETSGEAASPPKATLEARIQPALGTRPEVTTNADFYRVDINTTVPQVDAADWRLEVGGLVDNPLSLTLDQLRARPAVSQYITLSCISNPVGGDLISSAVITGLRLKDLVQEAGLGPNVQTLHVESADGFFETVTMQAMMDERTLLVYEMNGQPLPAGHGFPLRLYIPNVYGMKQPKWILRMDAADDNRPGYWVERGWSEEATVLTTSVIDVAVGQPDPDTGNLPFGGIAYSGARGISKVEIQVDDGPWMAAELRDPPLSPLTWVQWRYDWPPQAGQHVASVRAYDGSGALQIVESHGAYPDGATGIDTVSFRV